MLILRYGVRPISGRSECPHCEKKLAWLDLVPVLSWVWLRGRCRYCKNSISIQYPLVELLTALVYTLIVVSLTPTPVRVLGLAAAALLIAIFFYDLWHKIIPDPWIWTFNALAFLALIFNFQFSIFNFLAGPIAALPLFFIWFVSRGRWMGFGDVKLALGIGWLLGPIYGIVAIFFAFFIGAVIGLILIGLSSSLWRQIANALPSSLSRKLLLGFTMKSEVPFGPFLIASCFIVWFANIFSMQLPFLSLYGL